MLILPLSGGSACLFVDLPCYILADMIGVDTLFSHCDSRNALQHGPFEQPGGLRALIVHEGIVRHKVHTDTVFVGDNLSQFGKEGKRSLVPVTLFLLLDFTRHQQDKRCFFVDK